MDYPKKILQIAKAINDELVDVGISQKTTSANISIYDEIITNDSLLSLTVLSRAVFLTFSVKSGH